MWAALGASRLRCRRRRSKPCAPAFTFAEPRRTLCSPWDSGPGFESGALAGMEGVVVRQKGSLRVVLTVNLILQSVAVEVDGTELEPMDSGVPATVKSCAAWPGLRTAGDSYSRNGRLAWS